MAVSRMSLHALEEFFPLLLTPFRTSAIATALPRRRREQSTGNRQLCGVTFPPFHLHGGSDIKLGSPGFCRFS